MAVAKAAAGPGAFLQLGGRLHARSRRATADFRRKVTRQEGTELLALEGEQVRINIESTPLYQTEHTDLALPGKQVGAEDEPSMITSWCHVFEPVSTLVLCCRIKQPDETHLPPPPPPPPPSGRAYALPASFSGSAPLPSSPSP